MSLAPPPAPESHQVVLPILCLPSSSVKCLDGCLHLHLQPVEHVAAKVLYWHFRKVQINSTKAKSWWTEFDTIQKFEIGRLPPPSPGRGCREGSSRSSSQTWGWGNNQSTFRTGYIISGKEEETMANGTTPSSFLEYHFHIGLEGTAATRAFFELLRALAKALYAGFAKFKPFLELSSNLREGFRRKKRRKV